MKAASCTLLLLLFVSVAAACSERQDREPQPRFKGVELYSWRGPEGEWLFVLTDGTNRRKSAEEIQRAEPIEGVEALQQALAQLALGEQVFWTHAGLAGFEHPPAAVIREIQAFARERQVEVEVPAELLAPDPPSSP